MIVSVGDVCHFVVFNFTNQQYEDYSFRRCKNVAEIRRYHPQRDNFLQVPLFWNSESSVKRIRLQQVSSSLTLLAAMRARQLIARQDQGCQCQMNSVALSQMLHNLRPNRIANVNFLYNFFQFAQADAAPGYNSALTTPHRLQLRG